MLLLALSFALALAVRVVDLGEKSVWLDEGWSWWAAKLSVPDMIEWTASDKHPPFYYALLHYWIGAFGDSESMLRAPSVLAGALTVAILVLACVLVREYALGVLAGLLLSIHPMHVTYSQEARMYPLFGLLAIASSLTAALLVRRPSVVRAIVYAMLASALAYTHYSAFFVIAAHTLLFMAYALASEPPKRQMILLCAGSAAIVVVVVFAPWAHNVFRELGDGDALPQLDSDGLERLLAQLLGVEWSEQFWIIIAIPVAILGLSAISRRRGSPEIVFIAALAAVALVQTVFSLLATPVIAPRQASPYASAFAMLSALAVLELRLIVRESKVVVPIISETTAAAAALALGAIMMMGVVRWYDAPSREEWRAAAADASTSGARVYVWRGYAYVPLSYYMRGGGAAPFVHSDSLMGAAGPLAVAFSHDAPQERVRILSQLRSEFDVGTPSRYGDQITVFPIVRRSATTTE